MDGVAHDFNNLLAAILGNVEMFESRTDENASLKLLRNAVQSAQRRERLTLPAPRVRAQADALAESRRPQSGCRRHERSAADIDRNHHPLETRTKPGLWPALVDSNQIELVLLNLAINVRDAMPRGGTLTIETGNATLSGIGPADLPAGEYAVVSVSDTGTSMRDEARAKAFEPFFTTKEIGKGSGLGLSMVLGVARQSGGNVRITSRSVKGTSIEVYLPRGQQVVVGWKSSQSLNCERPCRVPGGRRRCAGSRPDAATAIGTTLSTNLIGLTRPFIKVRACFEEAAIVTNPTAARIVQALACWHATVLSATAPQCVLRR